MMKKGFALITVLVVLILLMMGIAAILQSVGSLTNLKSTNLQEVKDQYLAEAGMQRALWHCRTGGCATATENPTLEGSVVHITATETAAGSGVYRIYVCVGSSCT